MKDIRTIGYPNTAHGQERKVRDLNFLVNNGFRIVSENIEPGRQLSSFEMCCAIGVNSTTGRIVITLERENIDTDEDREIQQDIEEYFAMHINGMSGMTADSGNTLIWWIAAIIGTILLARSCT